MIPLMKNAFLHEHETKKALAEFILKTDKFSLGEQCYLFEKEFADYQEAGHAVLFNSGGSANLAILQALKNLGKLQDGARVGFSALTWSTNVMPIIQLNMIPVPIDCKLETLNVSSYLLEKRLKEVRLDALFITNALGFTGDLARIRTMCEKANMILIEDNCESLGTVLTEGKTGNFGIMGSFSFFVAHHMSTIEGGMVCTSNDELAEMLKIVRANGWDRNLNVKQQRFWRKKYHVTSELQSKYTFYDLGFNFRPTEITGFLGRQQMKYLEENINLREKNYKMLSRISMKNKDFIKLETSHIKKVSNFAFPVLCKNEDLRDYYVQQFAGAGVEIRPMIAGNIQRQPFYEKYVEEKFDLENADFINDCGFYFGNYPELNDSDLDILSSCLLRY
jgi:CDP-4-dehydro-6-deoxyglucose reductase, E1